MARTPSPGRATRPCFGLVLATCAAVTGCERATHDAGADPEVAGTPNAPAADGTGGSYPSPHPMCVYGCDDARTDIGLDAPSPLQFAAADVLALAEGTHEATLTYSVAPPGDETDAPPADRTTALTLTIARSGPAQFVASTPSYPAQSCSDCPDWVEVGVVVTLRAEDGAFNEQFPAVLAARERSEAILTVPLDLGRVQGTFAADVADWDSAEPPLATLSILIAPGIFAGSIGSDDDRTTYATWGQDDCLGAARVDEAAPGALSTARILDRLHEFSPLRVLWGDGTETDLLLNASAGDAPLCRFIPLPPARHDDLVWDESYAVQAVTLEATTTDRRLATTLPVDLGVDSRDGELQRMGFLYSESEGLPISAFATSHGIEGVDFGDATAATLQLDLNATWLPTLAVQGAVVVYGLMPNDCDETSGVCVSSQWQQLARGGVSRHE